MRQWFDVRHASTDEVESVLAANAETAASDYVEDMAEAELDDPCVCDVSVLHDSIRIFVKDTGSGQASVFDCKAQRAIKVTVTKVEVP